MNCRRRTGNLGKADEARAAVQKYQALKQAADQANAERSGRLAEVECGERRRIRGKERAVSGRTPPICASFCLILSVQPPSNMLIRTNRPDRAAGPSRCKSSSAWISWLLLVSCSAAQSAATPASAEAGRIRRRDGSKRSPVPRQGLTYVAQVSAGDHGLGSRPLRLRQ